MLECKKFAIFAHIIKFKVKAMKKFLISSLVVMLPLLMLAQGWPSKYDGVMLQGFYWDSFNESRWPKLESQADELAEFFKLVWIPQSAS
jgi:alpha-amylase